MKRVTILSAFVVLLAAMSPAIAAEKCLPLSEYSVEKTAFRQLPVAQAIKELLKGTPLELTISGTGDLRVTAEDVEGPLQTVLDGLSKPGRFAFSQKDCAVSVAFAAPVMTWNVAVSDGYVSNALQRWGAQAGWRVVWASPKDFPVEAEDTFSGSFEDAVYRIVESLSGTDAPVEAAFHPNRVVRITRFNGQSADLRR